MSQSYGPRFPTQGINPGHIHRDTGISPARTYTYKGGDPTDIVNNWDQIETNDLPDIFLRQNANGNLPISQVEVNSVPSSTITTLLKQLTRILSHGLITGGTITDNGDGTVTVAAGEGTIRTTDNKLSDMFYAVWAQSSPITIPNNGNKQIVVDYNNGNPLVIAVDDYATEAERRDRIYLGEAHNASNVLTIDNDPETRGDFTHILQEYAEGLFGIRVASGESVSETGTRNLIITAGVIWGRHFDDHDTPAIDTSGSDTFIAFYRSGVPGQYTRVTGQTQWNNTQYDDNSGTLATLTAGTYGVHFLMRLIDGKVGLLYGRAEYATQALAEAAAIPSDMPYEFHSQHAAFIARLVFLKSAATLATIMDIRPVIGGTAGSGGGASISLPLAVNQGGTGATTAAGARTNLSVSGGLHPFYHHVGTSQILMPHYVLAASAGLTNQNGAVWAIPLYFEQARTLSALILNVTTSAASSNGIRIALYNSSNGEPSSLLLDAGEIIASSTGIKTLAISQAVSKGVYWIAVLTQSNSAVITGFSGAQMLHIHGSDPTVFTTHRTGIKGNISYASAWPDPFNTIVWTNGVMPLIGHQLSA